MIITESNRFTKQFKQLPLSIQKKYRKQIAFLLDDFHYPSLHTKRIRGEPNRWEARIDYHYRFSFSKDDETLFLLTIGLHDRGLGKK